MRFTNQGSKDWYNTKPGWHEFFIPNLDQYHVIPEKMYNIFEWIYSNIDNCEVHARWCLTDEGLYIKFRYERDYIRFVLVWS